MCVLGGCRRAGRQVGAEVQGLRGGRQQLTQSCLPRDMAHPTRTQAGGRLLTHTPEQSPTPPSGPKPRVETPVTTVGRGRCGPSVPRDALLSTWSPPEWGLDPAWPYLIDEEDLGSHVDAHSRHSPDGGVHTCQEIRRHCQQRCTNVGTLQQPPLGGAELGVGGPAPGHRGKPSPSSSERSETSRPTVEPGNPRRA